MKTDLMQKILKKFKDLSEKAVKADYNNPRNILILLSFIILPFVAGHYLYTGLILGLIMSISMLWLLEKSPMFIKDLILEYPLAADLILSFLAVVLIGGYFGAGLTLGLGAAFTTVILSWALPVFAERKHDQRTA